MDNMEARTEILGLIDRLLSARRSELGKRLAVTLKEKANALADALADSQRLLAEMQSASHRLITRLETENASLLKRAEAAEQTLMLIVSLLHQPEPDHKAAVEAASTALKGRL